MGEAKRRREAAGVDVVMLARDEHTGFDLPDLNAGALVLEIGPKGELGRDVCRGSADWLSRAVDGQPEALVVVTVSGFDDDPREVLDIPEARQAFKWFGERLQELDNASGQSRLLNRLESVTRAIVMVSMGLVPRSALEMTTEDDPVLDEQWKKDRDHMNAVRAAFDNQSVAAATKGAKQ